MRPHQKQANKQKLSNYFVTDLIIDTVSYLRGFQSETEERIYHKGKYLSENFISFIYCVCLRESERERQRQYVGRYGCTCVYYMPKSTLGGQRTTLGESVFSFYQVGPRDQTQIVPVVSKQE